MEVLKSYFIDFSYLDILDSKDKLERKKVYKSMLTYYDYQRFIQSLLNT